MKSKAASDGPAGREAVAFGRSYFYALGGLTPNTTCTVVDNNSNTSNNDNHASSPKNDRPDTVQTSEVPYYTWERPPWWNDDDHDKHNTPHAIQAVVATAQSTVFLTNAGQIYQTGTLHGHVWTQPTPIATQLPRPVVELAAGRHFCLGRLQGGVAVVSWGAGHFGQLGLGASAVVAAAEPDRQLTFTPQPMVIPQLLPHAIGSPIQQIAAGDWHALALTESGRVWAWGSNRSHQCGRKAARTSSSGSATTLLSPMPVPLDVAVSQIGAGRSHSVAILRDTRQIYCWGSTLHGQCGNVVRKTPVSPHLVEGLAELGFAKISVAGNHTLALTTGGRLFSWGDNSEGQLGHSVACPAQPRAKQVQDLDFVAVAAMHELKRPVTDQKELYDLKRESQHLKSLPKIVDIFAGAAYSVAKTSAGHIYCFGSNDVGQLGIPVPRQLPVHDNTNAPERNATVREMDIQVFDSRHILLLPVRNQVVDELFVETVACGPNHLWCIGRRRTEAERQMLPARTLQEVKQQMNIKMDPNGKRPPATAEGNTEAIVAPSPRAPEAAAVRNIGAISPPPMLVQGDQQPGISNEDISQILSATTSLQIQTTRNSLVDRLTPLDAATPSTMADEFPRADTPATPSSAATSAMDTIMTTPVSPKSAKKNRGGIGMIRGLSAKFRRRFSKKKPTETSGAEAESDTETGHNETDQAK